MKKNFRFHSRMVYLSQKVRSRKNLIIRGNATSTAPIDVDPSACAANGQVNVYGLTSLRRVAEASAFPETGSPPVHLTMLMLAERIAAVMASGRSNAR